MSSSVCVYGFVPVRREPSERSEMVTQLLFGETYCVLETKEGWCRICTDFDNYESWSELRLAGKSRVQVPSRRRDYRNL